MQKPCVCGAAHCIHGRCFVCGSPFGADLNKPGAYIVHDVRSDDSDRVCAVRYDEGHAFDLARDRSSWSSRTVRRYVLRRNGDGSLSTVLDVGPA